jgi:hypothetical protein
MNDKLPPLPHAQYERFESMRQYDEMLDELVPKTQRVIRIFDKALGPSYNMPARCGLLTTFLRADPLNRLFVVVHETQNLERGLPRLALLLQRFAHVAKVRQTPKWARHIYDPFVIFDASHFLHRFHHDHMRFARGLNDVDGAQTLLDRYAELWEASKPSPVASVTGL